jgi:hypothetical protein
MIRLVCVLGHGHELLRHFINHYYDVVDEINFVVYESESSPRILNRSKTIIQEYKKCKIIKIVRDRLFDWEKVTILYNMIKNKHKNDWWVVADIDEFQVYPNNDIRSLIKTCEENKWNLVRGGFIDRVGEDGVFSELTEDKPIFEQYPMAGFFRYPMSGACPNKVSLMKGSIEITSGQHYAKINGHTTWRWQGWNHPNIAPYNDYSIQVHHFKWDSTSIERIKKVADINQDYAYSKEYFEMYDSLRRNNFRVDISNEEYSFQRADKPDFNLYTNWGTLINEIVSI